MNLSFKKSFECLGTVGAFKWFVTTVASFMGPTILSSSKRLWTICALKGLLPIMDPHMSFKFRRNDEGYITVTAFIQSFSFTVQPHFVMFQLLGVLKTLVTLITFVRLITAMDFLVSHQVT